jgi:hypothetical protein
VGNQRLADTPACRIANSKSSVYSEIIDINDGVDRELPVIQTLCAISTAVRQPAIAGKKTQCGT